MKEAVGCSSDGAVCLLKANFFQSEARSIKANRFVADILVQKQLYRS
ncbi:hypothetical protein [Geomonas agri]|nr:hypothetical protein [Geomonas agri]